MRCIFALLALGLPGPTGDLPRTTRASALYVRDADTVAKTLAALAASAEAGGETTVLVVFETWTFQPRNSWVDPEWSRLPSTEIDRWLTGLDEWARTWDGRVYAAASIARMPTPVGGGEWREAVRQDLERKWWHESMFKSYPLPQDWMPRLIRGTRDKRPLLAYIATEYPPERSRWGDDQLNRKLPQTGEYWQEEKIGRLLAERGVRLHVIAPEVRFGDFLPFTDLLQLPLLPRPFFPLISSSGRESRTLDPMDEFFQPQWWKGTDCPSALGYWPYARAATLSRGRYLFYPFLPTPWRDVCPYNDDLVDELAPTTDVTREELWESYEDDPVIQAFCQVSDLILPLTPSWDRRENGRARALFSFASSKPLKRNEAWREGEPPRSDWPDPGSIEGWEALADHWDPILACYDTAIEVLQRTAEAIERGDLPRPSRRSMANLRLCRFWLECSAFHLEAIRLYCRTVRKIVQEQVPEESQDDFGTTWPVAIMLSDCLDGYLGKVLTAEEEERLEEGLGATWHVRQGIMWNPAIITSFDWWRTKRDLSRVLKHLDPSLGTRALHVIGAAKQVMGHEGYSPWGWMVYYGEVDSCTPAWMPADSTIRIRHGSGGGSSITPPDPRTPLTGSRRRAPTTPRQGSGKR